MTETAKIQFSLRHVMLLVVGIGIVIGVVQMFYHSVIEAQRDAWLASQSRQINDIGGSIVRRIEGSQMPNDIDLSNSTIDCEWLVSNLDKWEYSELVVVRIRKGLAEQSTFAGVRRRFPHISFISVAK